MGLGGGDVAQKNGYFWSETDEPHASRRRAILEAHPEVADLAGYEWKSKYIVFAMMALHFYIATRVQYWNWPWIIVTAYVVGGTITQSLTLAIHELSHNMMFESVMLNRLFAMFANLPLVIAYTVSFKKYHVDHHQWQGVDGVDVDVPTETEARFFTTTMRKFLWVFFQVVFYAVRPIMVNPYKPGRYELLNWLMCLSFDAFMVYNFGWMSVGYFLLSMLLGLGPHPMAGHFIAEHYVFVKGYETYSYYGPLNFLGFWVGYHNEHHDFPRIPGSRLHKLREIAPEYYENLPQYTSWSKVIYDYITFAHISPYSRMKRNKPKKSE